MDHKHETADCYSHYLQTFGNKTSDRISALVGSWKFIFFQTVVLTVWVILNITAWLDNWDPYPFILLNLIVGIQATYTAPIIMMSQNRKEQKDRQRAENDYMVNLKSELEIRQLHEKVDNLVQQQWERLTEIQKLQLNLMDENEKEELKKEIKKTKKSLNINKL